MKTPAASNFQNLFPIKIFNKTTIIILFTKNTVNRYITYKILSYLSDTAFKFKMKLIIKKLQGGECNLEVQPTTTITEIKNQVFEKLKIPAEEQKLLFLGRTLVDEQTVQSYPTLKDGSKLNLIVKKPEKPLGLYDVVYKAFKKIGLTDVEATSKARKYVLVIEEKFQKYSWDDIERLSADCMREEYIPKEERQGITS